MTHRIRVVKPEIRILGLDTCQHSERVMGVVVRGGKYLDGLLNLPLGKRLGMEIISSKFYPELRLIMTHDPSDQINSRILSDQSNLPLVEVQKRIPAKKKVSSYTRFGRDRRSIYARSDLPSDQLRQLIDLSWTFGDMPEPVRVAHLLVKSISSRRLER